jgi:hypothetical protein
MPPLSISDREEGTSSPLSTGRGVESGATASTGGGRGTGSAASGGRECTVPNVQQWLVPTQTRCALGNLARASLSVMQAGEPNATDGPIVMATAKMEIMRTVTAITLLKKPPAALREVRKACEVPGSPGFPQVSKERQASRDKWNVAASRRPGLSRNWTPALS